MLWFYNWKCIPVNHITKANYIMNSFTYISIILIIIGHKIYFKITKFLKKYIIINYKGNIYIYTKYVNINITLIKLKNTIYIIK